MQRQLIIGERIMYGDGNTPLNSAFVVKIRGSIILENLRTALAKVQAKHPVLSAGVVPGKNRRPYFVTNAHITAIPIRIVERHDDDDWQRESMVEWATPFDMRNGPMSRMVWIRSAEVSELILVCHHCICDGASVATLLQEILTLLDQPDTPIGQYEAFNAIQDLIPAPYLQNKRLIRKGKRSAVLAWLTLSFVLLRKKPLPKGKDYLLHWKLGKGVSAAFVNRCKAEGTSVHAALCVAFLRAFQQIKGTQARNKVITPVDIRRFISAIKNDTLFAYAPTVDLSLNNDPSSVTTDFWVAANQIKEDLSGKIEQLNVFIQLMIGEYIHSSLKKLVKLLKIIDGRHDVTFSNMGRLNIPESYQSFEVETIYSPTVAFPWRNPNTLVTTTFRGQMDFAFMSNDNFLSYDDAVAIKETAMLWVIKAAKLETVA